MSSDGSYPTRASRRAERAPQTSRAPAGTAAAILILAAILGFGGGALAGNAGGDNQEAAAQSTADPGSDTTADEEAEADDPEDEEATPGVTLRSPQDGGTVASGDQIDFEGQIDPPVGGVTLTVERSLDGGDNWETFGSSGPITAETRDDGTFSTYVYSQREGPNHFRLVGQGPDGWLESNAVVVTIN